MDGQERKRALERWLAMFQYLLQEVHEVVIGGCYFGQLITNARDNEKQMDTLIRSFCAELQIITETDGTQLHYFCCMNLTSVRTQQ